MLQRFNWDMFSMEFQNKLMRMKFNKENPLITEFKALLNYLSELMFDIVTEEDLIQYQKEYRRIAKLTEQYSEKEKEEAILYYYSEVILMYVSMLKTLNLKDPATEITLTENDINELKKIEEQNLKMIEESKNNNYYA
jgi:hypothetical protein